MPCVLILLLLGLPRLCLFLMFMFSTYLNRAFTGTSNIWPVLGFLFMPFTTIAYAWSKNTWGKVEGLGLIAVIVAVLIDLGVLGASRRKRKLAD